MSECQYRKCGKPLAGKPQRGGKKRIYCDMECRRLEKQLRRRLYDGNAKSSQNPAVQEEKNYQAVKDWYLYWASRPLVKA